MDLIAYAIKQMDTISENSSTAIEAAFDAIIKAA